MSGEKQVAPARAPDLSGEYGRAWRIAVPADGPADWQASVRSYLVHRPGAHPFWAWWMVGGVHLRSIPGVKAASRQYAAAEHEVMILALNPKEPLPSVDGEIEPPMMFLTPVDFVQQVHGIGDAGARELVDRMVVSIVQHGVSPDSDFRGWWVNFTNDVARALAIRGQA